MKKIERVYLPTGNTCACGGNIVEIFTRHSSKWNGVVGPGSFKRTWVESDGFACDKCGQTYSEPVYHKTPQEKIPEQVEFEFTLSEVRVKRPITIDDIKPIFYYKKGPKRTQEIAGHIMKGVRALIPATKKATAVPRELKKLKVGDIVYLIESKDRGPHNKYGYITCSKEIANKKYNVLYACFE